MKSWLSIALVLLMFLGSWGGVFYYHWTIHKRIESLQRELNKELMDNALLLDRIQAMEKTHKLFMGFDIYILGEVNKIKGEKDPAGQFLN